MHDLFGLASTFANYLIGPLASMHWRRFLHSASVGRGVDDRLPVVLIVTKEGSDHLLDRLAVHVDGTHQRLLLIGREAKVVDDFIRGRPFFGHAGPGGLEDPTWDEVAVMGGVRVAAPAGIVIALIDTFRQLSELQVISRHRPMGLPEHDKQRAFLFGRGADLGNQSSFGTCGHGLEGEFQAGDAVGPRRTPICGIIEEAA